MKILRGGGGALKKLGGGGLQKLVYFKPKRREKAGFH